MSFAEKLQLKACELAPLDRELSVENAESTSIQKPFWGNTHGRSLAFAENCRHMAGRLGSSTDSYSNWYLCDNSDHATV